jgi:hypothetical protein
MEISRTLNVDISFRKTICIEIDACPTLPFNGEVIDEL